MVGVAGVMGLCGGVAEMGGRPGLMLTGGAATPGIKTFAFGFKVNSFAFGFNVDFFAAAATDVGVVDKTAAGGDEDKLPELLMANGDISGTEAILELTPDSTSDFCLW